MRFPFAREGFPFMAASGAVTALAFLGGWPILAWPALAVAGFVFNFFRDPERQTPVDPSTIVSPADGRVIKVTKVADAPFVGGEATLVSIFMSPLDVHVNRVPIDGKVLSVSYRQGSYLRAYADEASLDNERNAVVVEDPEGRKICFVQVAGFVARRIVCYLQPGAVVRRGARYGMIRFGSRADVYLPPTAAALVQVGDRTTAGSTALARWI